MEPKVHPRDVVHRLLNGRFHGAKAIFLGGSAARPDWETAGDLDLVVIYENPVENTRHYFMEGGWSIEAIVATVEDFEHILQASRKIGHCAACSRVIDSIVYPQVSAISERIVRKARQVVARGPAPPTPEQIQLSRITLLYLLKKLECPKNKEDTLTLAATLHLLLCRFYLRANGKWSATRVHLPIRLREEAPELYARICKAFGDCFSGQGVAGVRDVVQEVLAPLGGMNSPEMIAGKDQRGF